jgi:hypothetical protein
MTKFGRLSIGAKFLHDGKECVKVQPQKISCCKLKRNAAIIDGDKDLIIDGNKEVETIEDEHKQE